MHLSIHSKSPGFEVDMFVIPNKVENQSLIDKFLNGNKNPDKEIPVIDWTMDNDTLYYREYDQFEIKIDDNRQKKMAKDAIDFDQNNMRIAKALQNEIVALLTLSGKKRKENEDKPYFSASSLNSLGMALSTCQRVGRLALGESTENTNISTEATVNEAFQLIEEILGKGNSKSNSQLH